MADPDNEILLTEYKVNVDLYKHDDDLRQKRTTTFISVNLFLYGVVAFVLKESGLLGEWTALASIFAAVLGILNCFTWIVIHKRNEQYILFRRKQLMEIEARLGTANTFTNQFSAISGGNDVLFPYSKETFRTSTLGRKSSATIDYMLPWAMIVVWLAIIMLVLVVVGKPPDKQKNPAAQKEPPAGAAIWPQSN